MVHGNTESVAGRGVIVTGGTTGIGLATARLLVHRGAKVLVFGRHEKELDEALADLRQYGEAHGLVADAAVEEDLNAVFDAADQRLKSVDVLINNAAVSAKQVTEVSAQEMEYALKANLLGYMICCRLAIQRMRTRGDGHIVNVGSMSADVREPTSGVYVATKAGIQGFTESLRKEVNKDGIRVTLIEPGAVNTPIQSKEASVKREMVERMEMLEPEDIAEAVLYCLTQPKRCDVVSMQVRPLKQLI
jgi:NADP-dependent 3-hydroxy acid dehydrogenase YdfG